MAARVPRRRNLNRDRHQPRIGFPRVLSFRGREPPPVDCVAIALTVTKEDNVPRMIFVNLPVADLAKSMAFYEAIGAVNQPRFTDETAACMGSPTRPL